MRDCFILCFLQEKRASGNKSFFTANDIILGSNKERSGSVFRKLNVYVAKSGFLESKITHNNKHLCRAYRMTEETFKRW